MSELCFTCEHIHRGTLRLISARHPLRESGASRLPLTLLCAPDGEVIWLANTAAKMMRTLLAASGGTDLIQPVSGYRTQAEQQALYEDTLRERGEDFTRRYVALPGCSEHQTGLALDVGAFRAGPAHGEGESAAPQADGTDLDFVCPAFPKGGAFDRFRSLAALYGFIERYPEGKSEVTGIAHEPWHFRYVGWPHAKIITRRGWTLEDYIDALRAYDSFENALVHQENSYAVRMFTVKPPPGGEVTMRLAGSGPWQASGNNVDGVVVAVWTS